MGGGGRIAGRLVSGHQSAPQAVAVSVSPQAPGGGVSGTGRRTTGEMEFAERECRLGRLAAEPLPFQDDPLGRPVLGEELTSITLDGEVEGRHCRTRVALSPGRLGRDPRLAAR